MIRVGQCLLFAVCVGTSFFGLERAIAQTAAVGMEFQVNSYTTSDQHFPVVAVDGDGAFVIVWHSLGSSGSDTDLPSIQGQRYDVAGGTLGAQFQVNSYTTSGQTWPAVATELDGAFVIVWHSDGSSGSDSSGASIQGQRYDAGGNTLGAQFQVNAYTTSDQWFPAVAINPDGAFVVVWQTKASSGSDTSSYSIQGQRYDVAGGTLGAEFQVNSYTTSGQTWPVVATGPDGDFIVVWDSDGSSGSDSSGTSVQGQRYDAAGSTRGAQFQVNTYTTSDQRFAAVAIDPDGDFVVAWQSIGSSGSDASGTSVQGQRYDAAGKPLGAQFQVNSYTIGLQSYPAVAIDSDGDFVVVWSSNAPSGSDTSGQSIQGQRYDATGNPLGSQFQINSYTTSNQLAPAVAVDPDGDFVVAWNSDGSSDSDTSYTSIQGQRYRVTGDVGDRVWRDLDLDGLQDAGEPGIEGVAVYLFDSFGELHRSTITEASGLYHFNPKPGDYYVQFELPRVLSFTIVNRLDDDTIDSDADIFSGETDTFAVALLGTDLTWDAGMANGLGDRVWLDENGDGYQDPAEPGVAGIVVSLYDELDVLLATTVTDLDGLYSFQDLAVDRYSIGVALPVGGTVTQRDAVDDRFDSDVDQAGHSPPIDLARGALDATWDAGLILGRDQLPLIFADGFESEDTTAWGGVVQ